MSIDETKSLQIIDETESLQLSRITRDAAILKCTDPDIKINNISTKELLDVYTFENDASTLLDFVEFAKYNKDLAPVNFFLQLKA